MSPVTHTLSLSLSLSTHTHTHTHTHIADGAEHTTDEGARAPCAVRNDDTHHGVACLDSPYSCSYQNRDVWCA